VTTMTKGYIQVYTGDGKGKTTAAIGLAVRAAGAGLRVFIAQFMKRGDYNEIAGLRPLAPWPSSTRRRSTCRR